MIIRHLHTNQMNSWKVPSIKCQVSSKFFVTCYLSLATLFLGIAPTSSFAAHPGLTLRYQHYLFFINPDVHPEWHGTKEEWTYRGIPIAPLPSFRVDGDDTPLLPEGVVRHTMIDWNRDAIRKTLEEEVALDLDREPGSVIIDRGEEGEITFEGVGMLGRSVRMKETVELVIEALEQNVYDIVLPVEELQPQVTVLDGSLRKKGVSEVISVGESDFSGSPSARRHNIGVGLATFNGHVIEQGEEFSFNEVLGPVNRSTGYRQELVILGERTLPDYGGGLCQVSTTAYRGVWEYGFPIAQRRNHSYVVRYYSPQGTDATIYPPNTDMRFFNDSPGAILIQTYISEDDHAYFIYYGARDSRRSEIIGPYKWGSTTPPPDRTEYTTDIPPGTTRKVGERVPGMSAVWYRLVQSEEGEEQLEPFFSIYEARPRFTQIGVATEVLECESLICP